MTSTVHSADPMTLVLERSRLPETTDFEHAWVGMEPTLQTKKSVRKWQEMSEEPDGEEAYFADAYMLRKQKQIAKAIRKRYGVLRDEGRSCCMFARVELETDVDPWEVRRQNLKFHWPDEDIRPFEVRLSLDPETFEYSIKPVPLAWFYDERFVGFLQEFVWSVPTKHGLSCWMAHGGGQFSLSAKTYMKGSLLADEIAYKVGHPELATWMMDWPNPDDRAFRATRQRFAAFERLSRQYWAGDFHPRSNGVLTVENAYLDRGFGPTPATRQGLMDPERGPVGDARQIFQTNFAFGRAIRLHAQNVHPGYWQSAHPDEDGYRPDQIMRYGEGNLNRLQIAGELHVKSGKVVDVEKAPELSAPLDASMLTTEASWESRAQMSRTSARDYVEALLLDVHHARYLEAHPHVTIESSLLQDQTLGDAEETLKRHGGAAILDRLHREARAANLEVSRERMNTDWIEPEKLFWAAWRILPPGEKAALAREAITGFVERVHQAASVDPRGSMTDPMEWHRHRVHPLLWRAIEDAPSAGTSSDPVHREWTAWQSRREEYLARRPEWSPIEGSLPPWEEE